MPEEVYHSIESKMKVHISSTELINYQHQGWDITLDVNWNKKNINAHITLSKIDLEKSYPDFSIRNSIFGSSNTNFSLLTSILDASNFYGSKSEISEYLLSNKYSLSLLKQKKSRITWKDNTLHYTCSIQNSRKEKLNRVILCLEYLVSEIDKIMLADS